MAARKQFLPFPPADEELLTLLDRVKTRQVSEEELKEQRISFAFGNALNTEDITKESVRETSNHIRLMS